MIINNGFKQLREISQKRYDSLIAHRHITDFLSMGRTAVSFHAAGRSRAKAQAVFCWLSTSAGRVRARIW
jgi:hypothetical protein